MAQPPKKNGSSITVRWGPARRSRADSSVPTGDRGPASNWRCRFAPQKRQFWFDYFPRRITTDQEGRFRVAGLLPGYEFRLSDGMASCPSATPSARARRRTWVT